MERAQAVCDVRSLEKENEEVLVSFAYFIVLAPR